MGIIQIPKLIASVAKGYYKRSQILSKQKKTTTLPKTTTSSSSSSSNTLPNDGIGYSNPYVYNSKCGIFDIDVFGHMNNASYLNHAEYARWELTSYNGLMETMYRTNAFFIVTSQSIKYRREIAPLFRKFQIDTYVGNIDSTSLWM